MARQKTWLVGSGTDCDVVVPHPNVSANHCRLTRSATGFVLEDLQSSNGTFVNGVRLVEPMAVSRQDQITLGRSVKMPWPGSTPVASADEGQGSRRAVESTERSGLAGASPSLPPHEAVQVTVTLRGSAMVLGRDPQCDHVLDYPMVSWQHARITRDGTNLFVEDLNSANGTFVNGGRIRERTAVKPGDVVGLGSYRFSVGTDGSFRQRDYRGDLTVEARGISVDAVGRRLLDGVSLTIYPSEFVGLMGPSGAGKSTLMNVLNGYTPPRCGEVLINGRSLYQHFDEFRGMIGFVPQDDIIHSELTVREALFYSARLRLPSDFSNRDIHKRIDAVLAQLGLAGIDDVLIGSPTRKGISGGQRKRVNLAMELLTDPSVLFLDEPTSGLSSEDTLIVMEVLRQLADSGKTILLTIHQPSLEAFSKLDNVVVVAKDAGSADA
ncbi:MAG: FHA domain-containing protein, partial [Planctomycetaceae bacterium]|nr:FHA domain-containing protein [Planctomycetaceae bacterium]